MTYSLLRVPNLLACSGPYITPAAGKGRLNSDWGESTADLTGPPLDIQSFATKLTNSTLSETIQGGTK